MKDWLDVLQGATFVGLVIVSTYVGILRAGKQEMKDQIAGLRGDRDDADARVVVRDRTLSEERTARAAERGADLAQIAKLTEAVDILKETVTGEVHWVAMEQLIGSLSDALQQHHTEAMSRIDKVQSALVNALKAKP